MAPGEDLTKDEYLASRSQGLFGVQAIFERQRLFEAFDALGRQPEASVFTVGIDYVRDADGRESDPVLQSFSVKRIE
jgi:hypothetical protein